MIARAVVVPTLGRSPDLAEVAGRLRAECRRADAALCWVAPAGVELPAGGGDGERVVRTSGPVGFARAANLGLAATTGDAALVNDDALIEPGWLDRLAAALAAEPAVAAAQGINLQLERPALVDGCGLGWSRDWQAVQVGRGAPPPATSEPFEVFGASATAALYRRTALEAAALPGGAIFDERLGSWYEDVELAVRLRARGGRALCVPSARALHRGSTTGAAAPFTRGRLLARNRWWVVARLLGRRLPAAAPRMAVRDLRDLARRLLDGEPRAAAALVAGGFEALAGLPRFARTGAPLVGAAELARLRVGSPA